MLTPLERLEMLCDPGTLKVIRSVAHGDGTSDAEREDNGVVGGSGEVGGRPIFCYAEDGRRAEGALGRRHAETIVRILELAGQGRVPVVGFVESGGAWTREGVTALAGYASVVRASVALSGRVPQIAIVTGSSAPGGCHSPGLADFVIMTRGTDMLLTAAEAAADEADEDAEDAAAAQLAVDRAHERSGVCHLLADSDRDAAGLARDLLGYLPQNAWERPPEIAAAPPAGGDPAGCLPAESWRIYDVRELAGRIVDDGSLLELGPRWARNMVTALARLGGSPVGVVANQPRYLGGVIDAAAAEKGARFVRTCNAYRIPLIVLVDTPGFMPGTRQESAGVIRRGAKLLYAFIEAEVPKVSIVIRQAYGGGFITMNSKDLGADFAFAWPEATIGILGAKQAVQIMHRRAIAAADDPDAAVERLATEYSGEHQAARIAARVGVIDELVPPPRTRERLIAAFAAMRGKRGGDGRFGNIPL